MVIDTSFRLHGEFCAEKYSKMFLWNAWNVLMRMHRRKKDKNMTLSIHALAGTIKSLAVLAVPN